MIVDAINWLRILNVAALAVTLLVLAKPAFRSFTKAIQPKDVLWFILWGDALNRTWFVVRSVHFAGGETFASGEAEWLAACYVFALAIQALAIRVYLWGRQ